MIIVEQDTHMVSEEHLTHCLLILKGQWHSLPVNHLSGPIEPPVVGWPEGTSEAIWVRRAQYYCVIFMPNLFNWVKETEEAKTWDYLQKQLARIS